MAYRNNVVSTVSRQIRECSALARAIEGGVRIRRRVVCQVFFHDILLVFWDRKLVRKSSRRIDNLFAGALRLPNSRPRVNWQTRISDNMVGAGEGWHTLSSTDRSNEWTSAGECRIEYFAVGRLGAVMVQACFSIASDTVITAGVQDGDTHKAELGVFRTLSSSICRGEVGFIVTIGGRDHVCWFDSTAILVPYIHRD